MYVHSAPFRAICCLLISCLLTSCTVHHMGARMEPHSVIIPPARACILKNDVMARTGFISRAKSDTLVITRLVKMVSTEGQLVDVPPEDIDREDGTILLELAPDYRLAEADTMYLPLDAIRTVRVVEVDVVGTVFTTLLGIAGLFALLIAIIALTKESCPFVYSYDGASWALEGEIFSGAVHPPLERDDYLDLPALKTAGGEWRLRLTNEVLEIQQTNLAELYVYSHERGTDILVDKAGTAYVLRNPAPPVDAVSLDGRAVLDRIVNADDRLLESSVEKNDRTLDGVVVTFNRPPQAQDARLVLRAKNSFWLDHAFGAFYDAFGDAYHDWNESQKTESAEKLRQWSLDQNIPLSVYLKRDGEWVFHDYYNIAGPIALRSQVMSIPLPEDGSDAVQIKLLSGRFFWEIDYIALDTSPAETVSPKIVSVERAMTHDGKDVSGLLRDSDDQYYVMERNGEYAELTFAADVPAAGMQQSVFLHSRGHYEAIRHPSGSPDLPFLYSFRRAGRFNEFATELFFEMLDAQLSAKSGEAVE